MTESHPARPPGRPLRGAFVESYPHVLAGQQHTLRAILEAWLGRGHAATVLAPADGPAGDFLRRTGADWKTVPPPARLRRYGGAVYADGPAGKLLNAAAAARHLLTARAALKSVAADVLFCNDARG